MVTVADEDDIIRKRVSDRLSAERLTEARLLAELDAARRQIKAYEEILGVSRGSENGRPKRGRATKALQEKRLAAIKDVLRTTKNPVATPEIHEGVERRLGQEAGKQRQTADILRRDRSIFVQVEHGKWAIAWDPEEDSTEEETPF